MDSAQVIEALRQTMDTVDDGIACAYLFGSHARGVARATSDVDVAVLFAKSPPATLEGLRFDLAGALEARLHRPVEIVVLNQAPADLVHRVLRDGIIILERDRSARIRFEVKARNEYFDLAPVRARYRAGVNGRVT
jgi:predicted nucleotidyltransferase